MAKIELEKAYEASKVEDGIYKQWEESGFFNPDKLPGDRPEKFVISMPPPNVTGILHLGHALENSIMDIQIRYQRMQGKRALLVPGTDHAAVATQARVEDNLKKQGIKNPRLELGREGLLEKVREYAENSKATILSQIKKMGTSCDWSRLAYTFDEQRSKAVNELFKRMYNDGLIYKGYRVINWSVKGQSTCSDDELVYIDQKTKVYTFKYAKDFPIPIATTRPETKLGDTAVAVNPKDERYAKYIGQKFTVDVGAKNPLVITIIGDEGVDINYGTGAVGVTPAHSQIDYEMYMKNRDIGLIQVIGPDGKMTESAGSAYQGLSINEAREKFVEWLKASDLYISEEEITNNVGTSDRFGDIVEALPMEQWFIDVDKDIPGRGISLKGLMKNAVTVGHNNDLEKKITIIPERFHNTYLHWIDNLRPWCISRQIWWGHRIPVWYRQQNLPMPEGEKSEAKRGWEMKLNDVITYENIEKGTKTIETRVGRERSELEKNWEDFKVGDSIKFSLVEGKEENEIKTGLVKKISKICHFNNLDELFGGLDISKFSYVDENEYRKWAEENFSERIEKYGIWTFELVNANENMKEMIVSDAQPEGEGWIQEEDTLDTWFSSGAWTFSTLGWPSSAKATAGDAQTDLEKYHPTTWMQMGYEILFFWMARMILMTTYALDDIPFKDVYIHGILRDKNGKKFSKSLGNGLDPIETIKQYGTDALRLSLIKGITPGNDARFYEEKVEGARNFVNKLWNISRYILQSTENARLVEDMPEAKTLADKWVLNKLNATIESATQALDQSNFSLASEILYDFTWSDFADWYLEIAKVEGDKDEILLYTLQTILKLWHPFIPFVTEEIWKHLDLPAQAGKEMIMVAKWPSFAPAFTEVMAGKKATAGDAQVEFDLIKDIITSIRNLRSENKIEPAKLVDVTIIAGDKKDLIESQIEIIKKLARCEIIIAEKGSKPENSIGTVIGGVEIYISLAGLVDIEAEKQRLQKEIDMAQNYIKGIELKLANEDFIAHAPEAVVNGEKNKLKTTQDKLEKLQDQLSNLK